MPLKKPSELFNKKKSVSTVGKIIEEKVEINNFSEVFEQFKSNLEGIDTLTAFTESLSNYTENIEKINAISEYIDGIKLELKSYTTKEDLEKSSMAQLLVIEQCINAIEEKINGIDSENINEIKHNVEDISNRFDSFLNVDAPKYRKLIAESELRTSNRFDKLKSNINDILEEISDLVNIKYNEILEAVDDVNAAAINEICAQFNELQEEIPNYRNFIVESELKNEKRILSFQETLDKNVEAVNEKVDSIEEKVKEINQEKIDQISSKVNSFLEIDAPKYKNFIVESELKVEQRLLNFRETLDETIKIVDEKVDSIVGIDQQLTEQLKEKIQTINDLAKDASSFIDEIELHKTHISEKVTELESQVVVNESHIKKQNTHIDTIQEEVYAALQKLNLDELDEKNYEISKKIKYLEEIFEKFNEKQVLNENIIAEPPTVDNKDPLTPLDQNYVTLDQLQQHYRLFINRVQQQLATIGGGGETRLQYLDDIVGIATNPAAYDQQFLKYNHPTRTFVFAEVSTTGTAGTTGISISSNGVLVTPDPVKTINFLGVGNTFSVDGDTVNVSISSTNVSSGSSGSTNITYDATTQFLGSSSGIGTLLPLASTTTAGLLSGEDKLKISGLSTVATSGSYNDLINRPLLGTASTVSRAAFATSAQGSLADSAIQPGNPALSDAREWTALEVSQSEAEAGIGTTYRKWNSLRVRQNVVAWWNSTPESSIIAGLSTVATSGSYNDLLNKPLLGTASTASTTDFATAAQGSLADTAIQPGNPALSDAREWTALEVNQDEAEAGIGTTYRKWNSLRVRQNVVAWWNSTSESGIIAGLSTVATSGSYDDLSNRPIIGTGLTFVGGVLSATGGDSLTFSAGVTTFATSIELDMAALTGLYQTITLTDNLTFTTANRASGRMLTLRLINGSGPKTLTFPSGWVFLGIKPSGIASSKTAVMSLSFFGTADTDCVASYAVQL